VVVEVVAEAGVVAVERWQVLLIQEWKSAAAVVS